MPHKWEEQEYGGGAIAKVGGYVISLVVFVIRIKIIVWL